MTLKGNYTHKIENSQVSNKKKSYGKCPTILYTKVSDKVAYANSADPDQTVLIKVYTVCHSIKYFKKQNHKMQNLNQKGME